MKHLTLKQKYLALTGKGQTGGKYCNAIDEDIYDSSDWQNTMPASGYSFRTLESGKVEVTYTNYFACFDGWDSMDYDSEYFNSLEIAINSIWIRNALDDVYELVNALKHSIKVKNISPFDDDDNPQHCKSLKVDSIFYKDNYSNVYNPERVLQHLTNNIYPTLRGKE
jgi:hypothetical protein